MINVVRIVLSTDNGRLLQVFGVCKEDDLIGFPVSADVSKQGDQVNVVIPIFVAMVTWLEFGIH